MRDIACGDYGGFLTIYDIETLKEKFKVAAHKSIINCIDGIGGKGPEYGPSEICTGSRDGILKRLCKDLGSKAEYSSIKPRACRKGCSLSRLLDCMVIWISFGNSFNTEERVIAAGYDNGDVKLYDFKQGSLIWDTNLKNGVCGLEFDRRDIPMNKLVITTLESKFFVFDMQTFHPESGYTGLSELAHKSTIWGVKHLPQDRDIFITQGGNGSINLYKYNYPMKRVIEDDKRLKLGVAGSVTLLNEKNFSTQPIASFDWNHEKSGLGCMSCLDQTCKVIIVTRLNIV